MTSPTSSPAQTQEANRTIQNVRLKSKHHKGSNSAARIIFHPLCGHLLGLSPSHPYSWVPEYQQQKGKETHSSPHRRIQRKKFYAAEPQKSNSHWATPAIHHIMLLSPMSLKCKAAAGPLKQGTGDVNVSPMIGLHKNSKVAAMSLPGLHCVI